MLREPGKNAVRMVDMVAGKALGFNVDDELILADGTEQNGIEFEDRGSDFEGGEGVEGSPGSGDGIRIEVARRVEVAAVIAIVVGVRLMGKVVNEALEVGAVEEEVVRMEGEVGGGGVGVGVGVGEEGGGGEGGGVHSFQEITVALGAEEGGGGGGGGGEGDAHVAVVAPVGAAVDGTDGGGGGGGSRHDVTREREREREREKENQRCC